MPAVLLLALALGGTAGPAAALTTDSHPACMYNDDCKGEGRPVCFAYFCVDLDQPAGLKVCKKGNHTSCAEGQMCFPEPYQSSHVWRGVCVNSSEVDCSAGSGSSCDESAGQHCLGGRCAPKEYLEALKKEPCDSDDSSCQARGLGARCCLDFTADGRESSPGQGATRCCDHHLGLILRTADGGTAEYDEAALRRLAGVLQTRPAEQVAEICALPELAGRLQLRPSCPAPPTQPPTEPPTPALALVLGGENGEERSLVSDGEGILGEVEVKEVADQGHQGHQGRSSCGGLSSSLALLVTPLLLRL